MKGQNEVLISGIVLDETRKPIEGATVAIRGPSNFRRTLSTNSQGHFSTTSNRQGGYNIYAWADLEETVGMDYVPAVYSVSLQYGSTTDLNFILLDGASIYLVGDVMFVESKTPANYFRFSVNPEPQSLGGNPVDNYGSYTDLVRWYGFDSRLVVVPAYTEVTIEVFARITSAGIENGFTAKGKAGFFKLAQGENLFFDIREYSMSFNFETVKEIWDSSLKLLEDCEDAGFLVNVERNDLMNSYKNFKEALFLYSQDSYDTAFARIRNAYLMTQSVHNRLEGLIKIGSQSAFYIIFLFVFIASSAAYLVASREEPLLDLQLGNKRFSSSINLLVAVGFYIIQIVLFYLMFPGCHLVPASNFAVACVFSIVIGQGILMITPRLFSEKQSQRRTVQFRSAMLSAFSMACRNLRRRKMRTIMTLASSSILIFGFILFTSISPGFGLISKTLKANHPVDALLVVDIPEGEEGFIGLPDSFLNWLEDQPNITTIAPKLENTPFSSESPYFLFADSGESMDVFGMIGIIPSLEADIISLDKLVVEGDYLDDEDLQRILISSSLKDRLNVEVGDKLYGFNQVFIIRGFFDEKILMSQKDVDALTILPNYIEPMVGPMTCAPSDVIITTYETALTLPRMEVSRVVIQFEKIEDYSSYGDVIALTREYYVYESHTDSLILKSLTSYIEEKGMSLVPFLMMLVVLNVAVSFFGAVRERASEIASLSSVGLNPTHIATLFIAEGAIIGFIGGGLGYLLGIIGYRTALTGLLGALQVREKVSAEWGLIAVALAGISSVIASFIPAIQASTIVTPSLLRKWRVKESEKPKVVGEPWILDLPVKLMSREIEPFTGFMVKRMKETGEISKLRFEEERTPQGLVKKVLFRHSQASEQTGGGGLWSENTLFIKKSTMEHLDVELHCLPYRNIEDLVHRTASHVRKLIFEWNALTFELAAVHDPSLSQLYTLVNAYSPTTLYIMTKESDISDHVEDFRKGLVFRGIRPPKFVVSKVSVTDLTKTMKAAEEIVSRADIICISGEETALSTSLAIQAVKQKKIACYVVDDRPDELKLKEHYRELKIVTINE